MPSVASRAVAAAVLLALPPLARPGERPIQDNSFLIEEAYNQEAGVIQHISALTRSVRTGAWSYTFTEEWPMGGQSHQASITVNLAGLPTPSRVGFGDVALNYRWQAIGDGDAAVALAPRLTLLLPTGDPTGGFGAGGVGFQVNVPMSVSLCEALVAHTNVGGTWIPSSRTEDGSHATLSTFVVGQSLIWLALQNVNFVTELIYSTTTVVGAAGAARLESLSVNPGIRAALNFPGGLQVVPGISIPIGIGPSRGDRAIFFYLSLEHPFRPAGPVEDPS